MSDVSRHISLEGDLDTLIETELAEATAKASVSHENFKKLFNISQGSVVMSVNGKLCMVSTTYQDKIRVVNLTNGYCDLRKRDSLYKVVADSFDEYIRKQKENAERKVNANNSRAV